jgi:hypothetical protein
MICCLCGGLDLGFGSSTELECVCYFVLGCIWREVK